MKKLLPFILLIAGGIWFATQSQNNLFSKFLGYFAELEPASTPSLSVKAFTSKDLERRRMTIDDLPEDGSYTIIFLHTSDCALCTNMSDSLSVLMDKRSDVALRKVSVSSCPFWTRGTQSNRFGVLLRNRLRSSLLPLPAWR